MKAKNRIFAIAIFLIASHCFVTASHAEGSSKEVVVNFDKSDMDKTPLDFSTALTGKGGSVSWVVKEDATVSPPSKVLAQVSADQSGYRFPLCIYDKLVSKDVEISVRFKAIAGEVDRAAGLVARFMDKDNYYITRANALEDNVRLYKVVDGSRMQFAGANAKVSSGQWHSLKLNVKGNHFQVYFDDKLLFEADDKTFLEPGKVGLWTKADSVTYFDDFRITNNDTK